LAADGLKKELFGAKRGDALIWHTDFAHGGNPVLRGVTRKSVVTHYCLKYVSRLYAEIKKTRVFRHDGLLRQVRTVHGPPRVTRRRPAPRRRICRGHRRFFRQSEI
jgi:hypothetical protein